MATFSGTGRRSAFAKILFCLAVLAAGIIAGRLSIERPSNEVGGVARRDFTQTEKEIIVAALKQQFEGVTQTNVIWAPLIMTDRAGITDYCGTFENLEHPLEFYTQLVFQQGDPRKPLGQVSFILIAANDDPATKYVVSTACLRYGYGTIAPITP